MNPAAGDPTNPTGPVTPSLTPPTEQSGNTAPSGPVSTQQTSSNIGVAELVDQYEKRHRAIMSEKDKMANERDKAIAAQVEMQKRLTELQEQSQSALTGAAQTTQSAIDQSKLLADKIAQLEAENTRNKILLENPDLAPYAAFIPASSDAEKVKQAVEQLKEINKQQLARLAPQPVVQPPVPQTQGILDLYAGRPGMAPFLGGTPTQVLPGSNPAQMAPMGSMEDQNKAIEVMLREAQDSGDPAKFQVALEEAKKRAEMLIRGVVGSSS